MTSSDWLQREPWYLVHIKLGKCLKKVFSVKSPLILFKIYSTLKDLLQPGLPTMNKGILLLMHTNKAKRFSNKALFFAIPFGISILLAMKYSSLIGNFKKSLNLYLSLDIL